MNWNINFNLSLTLDGIRTHFITELRKLKLFFFLVLLNTFNETLDASRFTSTDRLT